MCIRDSAGTDIELFPTAEIKIPGNHNIENYLTAITAVWGDVSVENMRRVAREFPGVEHRAEFVLSLIHIWSSAQLRPMNWGARSWCRAELF